MQHQALSPGANTFASLLTVRIVSIDTVRDKLGCPRRLHAKHVKRRSASSKDPARCSTIHEPSIPATEDGWARRASWSSAVLNSDDHFVSVMDSLPRWLSLEYSFEVGGSQDGSSSSCKHSMSEH